MPATAGETIGREVELAELERFFDDAATGPGALVLEGEPGIGKTTLWRAAVSGAAERGFVTLT
jgi:predicted ATPase